MPADRDRIEHDLAECHRRLKIAREQHDTDAEWFLEDAANRLWDLA